MKGEYADRFDALPAPELAKLASPLEPPLAPRTRLSLELLGTDRREFEERDRLDAEATVDPEDLDRRELLAGTFGTAK